MAKIRVKLHDIHFSGMHYFDWLATGLWMLDERGEIEAEVGCTATTRLFKLDRRLIGAGRRAAPGLMNSLERGWHAIISGSVTDGVHTTRFIFDAGDSPYSFDHEQLLNNDLYFKCQMPASIEPEGFPIAEGARMPYHPDVITYQDRLRPGMLGRPPSRRIDKRANRRVLRDWERRAGDTKDNALLAYFGTDRWSGGGPEGSVMTRFDGLVDHPNHKRGELVERMRARYGAGVADARIINSQHPARMGPPLPDATFNALVGRSWHNINISGFRRSAPFRFIDAFLVGASVPTDELGVRWYAPLEEGVEIFDLGKMGYERAESVDWDHTFNVLQTLADEPDSQRRERRAAVLDSYRRKWHPQVFARYVVQECTRLWSA